MNQLAVHVHFLRCGGLLKDDVEVCRGPPDPGLRSRLTYLIPPTALEGGRTMSPSSLNTWRMACCSFMSLSLALSLEEQALPSTISSVKRKYTFSLFCQIEIIFL
ncbi:hypothetical protein TNCV_1197331 [Trichonephila clavipes]|uniref:Uncharacterized protein n=1 Tax=Trichonephila clavipes TaxID=2585209 RepID=A0A8X6VDZ8_TRICX|nr:hypothetical protein TNCV_1197331 [Trichonephila clavipes]